MSRFEGEIAASAEARLSVADVLSILGQAGASEADRAQAIACYLAGGEGWKDAVKRLGGAFAPPQPSGGEAECPGR